MEIYAKQQQLMDEVCETIASFRTLIAPKDESKEAEYGFIPGMNNMQNEVKQLDDHSAHFAGRYFPGVVYRRIQCR